MVQNEGFSTVFYLACLIVFYLACLIVFAQLMHGEPPPPSVVCSSGNNNNINCTLSSSYGVWNDRKPCQAAAVVYPSTEEELVAAVAEATRRKQKMKTVTRWSHSIPKWACPGGTDGLLISTQNYTQNILVDHGSLSVTVDSGVGLRDLIDTLFTFGLALPHAPYWAGVTIGGLLSTGSHGSSLFGKGSALHEYVLRMSLVVPASQEEGFAKIIQLTHADEDLKAAKVSLGVLGVISQVTFMVEPLFKRSITNVVEDDHLLEENVLSFALAHEFGDITWHPSQYKVVYRKDDRAPVNTPGNGVNDFIGFQAQKPLVLSAVREAEIFFEKTRNHAGKCLVAKAQIAAIAKVGAGLKNDNNSFTHYPVIGFQNQMQASGSCLVAPNDRVCGWDPRIDGLFFYESAFLISFEKIGDFIKDVKLLRENNPSRLCGTDLYYGLLLRFVKKSSAYLGAIEDSVEVNFNYFRQKDEGKARLDEDIWEEIEQMARYKYNGLPSWGKNRNVVYSGMDTLYQERIHGFKEAMDRLDSQGLFSSEWSDEVLGRRFIGKELLRTSSNDDVPITTSRNSIYGCDVETSAYSHPMTLHTCSHLSTFSTYFTPSCALDGMCFCLNDLHCAPKQGYLCMHGLVYEKARVCRYQPHENSTHHLSSA